MDNGSRGVRLGVSVLVTAIMVALIWVGLSTVWMWHFQERVVFQPPADIPLAPESARQVEYAAKDGHRVFGYLMEPKGKSQKPRVVVIAFHGNADLAAWQVPWARELVQRTGVSVLLPEYRGYAGIPGQPTYVSAAADALGALEFVRSELQPMDVILYGHSLGTAVATELAAHMRDQPPRSLVLVSPFTSARDMAMRMLVPPIPGIWPRVSRVHYDTRALVTRLECPVFVAHGRRDLNIPDRMGRQVHAAARRPGGLLIVTGAGHNDVAQVGGEHYWRWLTDAVAGSQESPAVTSGR